MNTKRVTVATVIAGLLALGTALPGVASARDHRHSAPQVSAQPRYHHGHHRHQNSAWRHRPHYRHWDHRWHHRWHRREFDRRYSWHHRAPRYRSYYDRDDGGRAHIIIRYRFGLD
ncbi:MAG: hypothetical protein P8124_03810 [Gammaproteobacteria bacterium]